MNVKVYFLCCHLCGSDRQILTNVEESILKASKDLLGVEIDGMLICNSCCEKIGNFAAFKADVLKKMESSSPQNNMVTSSVSPTKTQRKKQPRNKGQVKMITFE